MATPKTNSAGLVTPSKQMTANVGTPFGQAQPSTPSRPVAESYTPAFNQTLNVYGAPSAPKTTTTAATPKVASLPTPKTDAQINAELAAVQAGLDEILKNVNAFGAASSGSTMGASSSDVVNGSVTPMKKEVIPNVAYDTISKILESYNITGLASVLQSIRDEYPEASSDDLLTLLQFDPRYNSKFNERFSANLARQKAGLSVLSPSAYLKLEESYKKIFSAYNLPQFNNQSYYDKFILNNVDSTELTDRIQLAYDRVMGDDVVNTAFKKFYPSLGMGDIVAGMLDPVNQMPTLERKVKAAEVGGAALRQGLTTSEFATTPETSMAYSNVSTGTLGADVLAQQGLTKAQAEAGYKTIAGLLPTAEKLSSIYGGTADQYGRVQAEQESLQGLASAKRKREQLTNLEIAQFGKQSGLGKGALGSTTNI
jgi:hypothetical protein